MRERDQSPTGNDKDGEKDEQQRKQKRERELRGIRRGAWQWDINISVHFERGIRVSFYISPSTLPLFCLFLLLTPHAKISAG